MVEETVEVEGKVVMFKYGCPVLDIHYSGQGTPQHYLNFKKHKISLKDIQEGDWIKVKAEKVEDRKTLDVTEVLEHKKAEKEKPIAEPEQVVEKIEKQVYGDVGTAELILADKMDEAMMIKEYLVGTEPYVYEVPSYICSCGRVSTKPFCNTCRKQISTENYHPRYRLSWAGWTEAMRRYGNIHADTFGIRIEGNKELGYVYIKDTSRNNVVLGVSDRQSYNLEFKNITLISKAYRNAIAKTVPKPIVDKVIEEALKAKSVVILSSGSGA